MKTPSSRLRGCFETIEMFEEFCGLVQSRNELTWMRGEFDPPGVQFDFNGLWFDAPFTVLRH